MNPAITIGIMTHNYARFIGEAIDSVLAQRRNDWEMIISDDASTDGTAEVVKPYLTDPRISYCYHDKNLGQAGNWSFLLRQGSAGRIVVLHADDHWRPGFLDRTLAAFESDPEVDMVYANWLRDWVVEKRLVLANDTTEHVDSGISEYERQVQRMSFHVSATAISRRSVEAAGLPDPTLRMVVDYEYLLRCTLCSRKVYAIADPLIVYRAHESNATADGMSSGLLAQEKEDLVATAGAHVKLDPRAEAYLPQLRHNMAGAIFSMGVTAATNGNTEIGGKLMSRAARLDPRLLAQPKHRVDMLLSRFGRRALPIFRRLHRNRVIK